MRGRAGWIFTYLLNEKTNILFSVLFSSDDGSEFATLWYQQKKIKAGKEIKAYNKTRVKTNGNTRWKS